MSNRIWMARHGNRQDFVDPDWAETAARPHDPDLSPDGKDQAQQLAQRLHRTDIQHLLASPFLRTVHTAHYVAEALDLPLHLDAGLAEWMNADWFPAPPARRSVQQLAERFPHIDVDYQGGSEPFFPETRSEVFERVGKTIRRLADTHEGPLLIIAHGVTITGAFRELGSSNETEKPEGALCSLHRFDRTAETGWQMTMCEEISHLNTAKGTDRLH